MTERDALTLDRQTDAIASALRRAGKLALRELRVADFNRAERRAIASGERVRRALGMDSLAPAGA